jgi:hypothetical protein
MLKACGHASLFVLFGGVRAPLAHDEGMAINRASPERGGDGWRLNALGILRSPGLGGNLGQRGPEIE